MTRDEYLEHIYAQRREVYIYLRGCRVPATDIEILIDKGIESCIRSFEKGKPTMSLRRGVGPWAAEYFKSHVDIVVPVGGDQELDRAAYQHGEKEDHED